MTTCILFATCLTHNFQGESKGGVSHRQICHSTEQLSSPPGGWKVGSRGDQAAFSFKERMLIYHLNGCLKWFLKTEFFRLDMTWHEPCHTPHRWAFSRIAGGSRRAQGTGAALVTAPLWCQSQRVLQRIPGTLKSNHQCRVLRSWGDKIEKFVRYFLKMPHVNNKYLYLMFACFWM